MQPGRPWNDSSQIRMARKIRIGGACLNQTPLDWQGNYENILSAIKSARDADVQLLCLPELCVTGYGCEDWFLSDWVPEKALDQVRKIIPHTDQITITVGLPIRKGNLVYNCIAIISDGELMGFYAKHNLANEGVHYEPRWFASWPYHQVNEIDFFGETTLIGAISLDLLGIKTGFEICEDAWQEDRPACNLVTEGIELILNPSASHFSFGKEAFREKLVIDSSRNFNCTYLYANLLGNEAGRMIYDGDILIARKGRLIGHNRRLSFRNYNLLSVEVDFDSDQEEIIIQPDWENKIQEMGQVLPLALFDYLRKSRSNGFVLSLSGGADSSCIATMVARMVAIGVDELGQQEFLDKINLAGTFESNREIVGAILTTAYQGTVNSSGQTMTSARTLADSIGSTHYEWVIDDQVNSARAIIENAIGRTLNWETDDVTLQNIQARSRSPLIWMLANIKNCLLLTTSNRSEGDVGYATMDGDTSGSISPIAAIDKSFILEWLNHAEAELGHDGLKNVNRLQPTAELRPTDQHQTDEDDLMPYPVLVAIERLAIKEKKSPKAIYNALKSDFPTNEVKTWIRKFFRLWAQNQWKRERIAPSFHLDDFNVDPRTWCRFPILSSAFSEELENL